MKKTLAGLMTLLTMNVFSANAMEKIPENHNVLEMAMEASGPTLIFSDSPELVYDKGILYKDIVKGDVRVFLHHVNMLKKDMKLAVIIKPVNVLKPVEITWAARGVSKPNKDFYVAAKESQKDYFEWPHLETFTDLKYGAYTEVLGKPKNKEGVIVKKDELVTGMFDFNASDDVEVTVIFADTWNNVGDYAEVAPILPIDEHPLRGTFKNADLRYVVNTPIDLRDGKAHALSLANQDDPHFLNGIDATTGKPAQNYGNYGVVYTVRYSVLENAKGYKIGINPWGGYFAGFARDHRKGKSKLMQIPGKGMWFDDSQIQLYNFAKEKGKTKRVEGEFIWSPPGAAFLPIRMVFQSNE